MTLTIMTMWTYFKRLQVRVDQLIPQPNFINIVIIWWEFVTGILPPYSLLTNSHHGGFLSWWEFAVRPYNTHSQIENTCVGGPPGPATRRTPHTHRNTCCIEHNTLHTAHRWWHIWSTPNTDVHGTSAEIATGKKPLLHKRRKTCVVLTHNH